MQSVLGMWNEQPEEIVEGGRITIFKRSLGMDRKG